MAWLGVDFGTSNTAAAVIADGRLEMIALEPGSATIPTAVFFDFNARETLFGAAAAMAMIEGREGRFMRALKSVLGTPLAREKRQILNRRLTLIEVIAEFLTHVKAKAEAQIGTRFDKVLSGRPVHFHSADPVRDSAAAEDLRNAYLLAGFTEVAFLPEPEAAALAAEGEGRGLIVDIGGGTSDFSIFEPGVDSARILVSDGVRIGGTDFDKALSLQHVMPLFGLGTQLNREFGSGTYPAPTAMFHDLAAWEKIAFVYDPALLRDVRKMAKLATEPRRFERLVTVLEHQLGHDVAYAVEAAKIAANDGRSAVINLGEVERGLAPSLTPEDLRLDLMALAHGIGETTRAILARTEAKPERIVYVGGSSLMTAVREVLTAILPGVRQETSEVFTAVVHGLAIAASKR